jgi:hypothetical protein
MRAVRVSKEDVDAVVRDFGVAREAAERVLRAQGGDLSAATRFLILGDAAADGGVDGVIARLRETAAAADAAANKPFGAP